MVSQLLMAATTSERLPSLPCRSMARPRLVCAGVTALGFPSISAKCRFMFGKLLIAWNRVTQHVGEADLAAAGALEVVVDDDAVVEHQLCRDGAHAGRRRHLQRGVHVLDDRGG